MVSNFSLILYNLKLSPFFRYLLSYFPFFCLSYAQKTNNNSNSNRFNNLNNNNNSNSKATLAQGQVLVTLPRTTPHLVLMRETTVPVNRKTMNIELNPFTILNHMKIQTLKVTHLHHLPLHPHLLVLRVPLTTGTPVNMITNKKMNTQAKVPHITEIVLILR